MTLNIKIAFEIKSLPMCVSSCKKDEKSLEIKAEPDSISIFLRYDWKEKPLILNGEIAVGDRVEVILLDYIIELRINGKTVDEEWPSGNALFTLGDEIKPDMGVCVTEYIQEETEEPSVLYTFENAQGWRPGGGVFVGDCMPYRRGDEYHVLYLKDRRHHGSKWGMGAHQWAHISTKDFKVWQAHPMAVPITKPWEGSICTGSWIQGNGKEYLYYTIRRSGMPALISRSVSSDGYHFKKDERFGFTLSEKYNGPVALSLLNLFSSI